MDADWAGVGQGERLDTVEEVEVAWGDFAFAGYWEAGVEGEGVNDIVAGFGDLVASFGEEGLVVGAGRVCNRDRTWRDKNSAPWNEAGTCRLYRRRMRGRSRDRK